MAGRSLYGSEEEKLRLMEGNLYLQFRAVGKLVGEWNGGLQFTPEIIKELHRIAMQGIYSCAGEFRLPPRKRDKRHSSVKIAGTLHRPPEDEYVEGLIERMCERVNDARDWGALKATAYLLWRICWIHPFYGGNGRTARAAAYLALCVRLKALLPGQQSIAAFISQYRDEVIAALKDADAAWANGVEDVTQLESLLDRLLRMQLATPTRPVVVQQLEDPRMLEPGGAMCHAVPPLPQPDPRAPAPLVARPTEDPRMLEVIQPIISSGQRPTPRDDD